MTAGIGPHDYLLLHLFGLLIEDAWDEVGYLVGSSQRGEEWRDIDIRVMLSDEAFDSWFGTNVWPSKRRHQNSKWRAHMLAWSKLGQEFTGLPIDFQVERLTEANRLFPSEPRNPLIYTRRPSNG